MYFIGKKFGLWFYTSRAALDSLCYLQNPKFPTWVFPDRVQYVEGKTNAFIPIGHAFNRVGDKYIDITFEFALEFRPNAIRICGVWRISGGSY
jgi:hypothetical protein